MCNTATRTRPEEEDPGNLQHRISPHTVTREPDASPARQDRWPSSDVRSTIPGAHGISRRFVCAPAASVPWVDSTYTVAELSRAIARAVSRALPDEVWVEGEIRDLSRSRNGHVYFTLIDPDDGVDQPPVLPVSLFASDKAAVNRVLVRSGAMRMTDGVHIRIRGRIGHYAPRGTVQLRMTWIDTDFTIGRLAAARRALLHKLEAAGHLERNALLGLPRLPLRIGLITSIGSAAHADFVTELERSGYGFAVAVADARVQGIDAEQSIVAALRAMAGHAPDIVALVRGGGAQTDLAAFDAEAVAIAIAHAPFPVITGIGHEIDTTVADHVSAASLKTPTACAQHIVAMVDRVVRDLDHAQGRLVRAAGGGLLRSERRMAAAAARASSGSRLHLNRHEAAAIRLERRLRHGAPHAPDRAFGRLSTLASRIRGVASADLGSEHAAVDERSRRLQRETQRSLAAAARRLAALDALRRAHAPERMLARGWSVTYGADGRPLRDLATVSAGDEIRTRLQGGEIVSTVDTTQEDSTT